MKNFWLDLCKELSAEKAEFYSGARKIIRRRTFTTTDVANDLNMEDCGFTKSKMSMLRRNYYVPESIAAAKTLWDRRVDQDKYGSVGFSCYGHYIKGGSVDQKRSKRASVMGPCIQSVTMTLTNKRTTSIDLFYRTTELFKKWPADLVFLRHELLPNFSFKDAPITDISFHFANITVHPMYAVTIMPHLDDPVKWLQHLKKWDPYFYKWVVKWTARYLCKEYSRGILKFSQALRVRGDAERRLDKRELKRLQEYLRNNHPGYRDDKGEDDDED